MSAPLPLYTDGSGPLGQKGQRGAVLLHLKREQRLTARQLADRLGVSLNAARHHLKELEAEGLVEYQREHRGVGAPAFAYRLSPAGEALFPRRYETTLTAVLDQMVEREGRHAAVALLESYFAALARRVAQDVVVEGRPAVRVGVKVRWAPFETRTRSVGLPTPSSEAAVIEAAALTALEGFEPGREVRLVGVRAELDRAGP